MTGLKTKQSGFTIVELLIVIVVIGILAGLVVTTFNGIQQRGRDTERQTDVKALHTQVEAYYAQNGKYPTLANLHDATFRTNNMKGFDSEALVDPKGDKTDTTPLATAAAANVYAYVATPSGCDNGSGGDCTGYTLTATLEAGGTFVKNSLN
jgi:prepilin-type N-terminal cleavage/methylation domain-containing protein